MKRAILMFTVALLLSSLCLAGQITYIEDFALAKDRAEALKQLIPGTKDYYYYHCLHYQNTGQKKEYDKMLAAWVNRYKLTGRVYEIKDRQALIEYENNPRGSLDYIARRLNLQFNHQKETLSAKKQLSSELNPNLISRETLTKRAFARHSNTLNGFEHSSLDWLVGRGLTGMQRRGLLARLKRPDYAKLPDMVIADLKTKNSRGFGSLGIHRLLLLSQLNRCAELDSNLLKQSNFVNTYLTKLRPGADSDWKNDAKVREAYLDRLWAFVKGLAPVHNSLKAHVMYHRLVHDRARGVYDKKRFMEYIQLPRSVSYVNQKWINLEDNRRWRANLAANYQSYTLMRPVGSDEPVVRSYLLHFFVKEDSYKPYMDYINDGYLKYHFAEAKIVNGIGNMEDWYSLLPPSRYQQLKERIDLDFAWTNKKQFGPAEKVTLDLDVKNVKKLLVKVYQINALNYYRRMLREINTDINLDGLVAYTEKTVNYGEPPLRRVRRTFTFPTITKRGVYVIDFIGNGKASRALIRKGKLRFLERTSTAGHVLTILDEANKKVADAAVWLAGHKYDPGKDGTVTIPYSNSPSAQPIVLAQGEFACLDRLSHKREQYVLQAGFHVEREALLKRKKATVLVRPVLQLNGVPVTLSVLTEVKMAIISTDLDGISSTQEAAGFKLFEDREATHTFKVPERTARISFILRAKVKNLSQNKKQDLTAAQSFSLNAIDRTEKVEDLHLKHAGGAYYIDVLGKTGEPKAGRPVNFSIKHRDFKDTVPVTLQTDANGRVTLGKLTDIAYVKATGPQATAHTWNLVQLAAAHNYRPIVHGKAGEAVVLPYMGKQEKPIRSEFSLLEKRGVTFVADRFNSLRIKGGMVIVDDLPAGDYDLLVKPAGPSITIRLADGRKDENHVLGMNRHLEVQNEKPLQIVSVTADAKNVKVQLANATKFARVHVAAGRYIVEKSGSAFNYSLYGDLSASLPGPGSATLGKAISQYIAGRDIGDEYRYILDRKYAKKYAGNMLKRPGLLLNPWAIRKTEAGRQVAKPGRDFGRAKPAPVAKREGRPGRGAFARPTAVSFANLDFLAAQAVLVPNLEADKDGTITIDRKALGDCQHLHIVAIDPENIAYRQISLAEVKSDPLDLRLHRGLDAKKHFTQKKQISVVRSKASLTLDDPATSKFETYDTVAKVYRLYSTLTKNATLREFSFILNWPKLKPAEKQAKYSKYACHELSFFIYKKDPDFFKKAVLPYLLNKKDKTFMDHWLTGADLSQYMEPWSHAQLNIVERALLAQRIKDERPHTARHVKDLYDLIPPNIERFNYLFRTALKAGALEAAAPAIGLDIGTLVTGEAEDGVRRLAVAGLGGARFRGTPAPRRAPAGPPKAPTARPRTISRAQKALEEAPAEGDKKLAALRRASGRDLAEQAMRKKAKAGKADAYFAADKDRRGTVRQLYRKLDKTQEWAENNYYHLPIEKQNASLITTNAFWKDYAAHDGDGPFLSRNLAEASRNFPEMMLAIAVLDVPFEAAKHKGETKEGKFTATAGSDMVIFHKEIKPAQPTARKIPILVSQNFFRHGDRYRFENNQKFDKYVTDEFLIHVVYGCQVVITNPTSSPRKLDVLIQIPRGAMPVIGGKQTRSVHIALAPYHTQTFDYYFYFPGVGKWPHYPVHVAADEKLIAFGEAATLNVVEKLSKIDKTSWDYISQHGTDEQVMDYLKAHNLGRIKLSRIAWRVREAPYFGRVIALLTARHVYDNTLWSYGLKHDHLAAAREYLQHSKYANQCGSYIDTKLLTIDPVIRKSYQHLEYSPLVNARAHQLGKTRKIVNERFSAQYHRLLKVLSYRRDLDDHDLMATTYYLLLQDRVEQGLGFFKRVDAKKLATRLQYDYFAAYIGFYEDNVAAARKIAQGYADHPVDRWRNIFAAVVAQADEIGGKVGKVIDDEDRAQIQAKLAATEAGVELKVEAGKITINYQSLTSCLVNYYLMDIELLFSRNPFVQSSRMAGQFSFIRPNLTQEVKLPKGETSHTFDLPKEFAGRNVMVEAIAGSVTRSQAYYANSLAVQVIENYGQVKLTHAKAGKALAKVYVKVYARMRDGKVRFYKDGYTDLRGRFDYTSLNTNELDFVEKFSLLILSDTEGAVVREAAPPKR